MWLVSYPLFFVVRLSYIFLQKFEPSLVDISTNYCFFSFLPFCVLSCTVPDWPLVCFSFGLRLGNLFRLVSGLYPFTNRHFALLYFSFRLEFYHILPTPLLCINAMILVQTVTMIMPVVSYVNDEVCCVYHESDPLPLTPFRHSLLLLFFSNIGEYGGQLYSKGISTYLSIFQFSFGVVYFVLACLSHLTIIRIVGGLICMMGVKMVIFLLHVFGFCVSLFRSL